MTAAAPISMASQACEGRPMPASTMMGRSISSIRIWIIPGRQALVRTDRRTEWHDARRARAG